MKQLFLFTLLCCACAAAAQSTTVHAKRISGYAGLSPCTMPMDDAKSSQTAGIQHEFRSNPVIFGIEFAQQWRGPWHYFISAQGALNFIQARTAITPPQPLPPAIVRVESQSDKLEAFQLMIGGGMQAHLLERKWFLLRTQLGAFAAYVQDRNDGTGSGIQLLEESSSGEFTWEYGGDEQHQVSRSVIPVVRAGLGADITPPFAQHFSLGLDMLYLISPSFIEGSWSRSDSKTSTLVTSGSYKTGWGNLLSAVRLGYRF